MSTIAATRKVFVSVVDPIDHTRYWLINSNIARNQKGELVLFPNWSSDASDATGHMLTFEYAVLFRDRWIREGNTAKIEFSYQAGNTARMIEE